MTEIKLPDLGEGVTEGELVDFKVKVGDKILKDQVLAEVMTDKATMEVPSPVSGVIETLHGKSGDIIEIGSVLVTLKSDSASSKSVTSSQVTTSSSKKNVSPSDQKIKSVSSSSSEFVKASPYVRKKAQELSVDLSSVTATGPEGQVTKDDLLNHTKSPSQSFSKAFSFEPQAIPCLEGEERVALKGVRKKIAENMQKAKWTVPHFTLMEEAPVDELYRLRSQLKIKAESQNIRLTYLPFVIKILVEALKKFPEFNASIDDKNSEIVYKKYYHIGIGTDTPQGLLVPVLKDADKKGILKMAQDISELSQKARDSKLSVDEMRGSCITITNIGSLGGSYATPIINHPEVAILGMYRMHEKAVYQNGQFVPQKTMNFSITCDHRLIDGAVAARFMKYFCERVSQPFYLLFDE